MNFIKTPITPDYLALAYSQVMIGMLSDAEDFSQAVADRGEGETDLSIDLLPHVRALAHAVNMLSDELEPCDIDLWRDIYQAFGTHIISQRDGDLLDITQSDSGGLAFVHQIIFEQLNGALDTLSAKVCANVFTNAYLWALPRDWLDLQMECPADIHSGFKSEKGETTITPVLYHVQADYGFQLDDDLQARARAEYDGLRDEEFNEYQYWEMGTAIFSTCDFMRVDHPDFGTVGELQETAFSRLLLIHANDGETFHIVRESE